MKYDKAEKKYLITMQEITQKVEKLEM